MPDIRTELDRIDRTVVVLKSQRGDNLYVDATHMYTAKATRTDGAALVDCVWAKFYVYHLGGGVVCFESVRYPNHYLDMTTAQHSAGGHLVKLTHQNSVPRNEPWARFSVHGNDLSDVAIRSERWTNRWWDANPDGLLGTMHSADRAPTEPWGRFTIAAPPQINWMTSLSDAATLPELNIPGSHDSGTYKLVPRSGFDMFSLVETIPEAYACCQSIDLESQLRMGIRFLDIRCRHIGDSFTIHHGAVYARMNFDEALQQCIRFLDAWPSETIIMSIMEEHNKEKCTRSFGETFEEYVRRYPRWHLGNTVPRLGDVRGKIVLMNRFDSGSSRGINWRGGAMRIQDEYNPPGPTEKWKYVRDHLDKAVNGGAAEWYVNFASAYRNDIIPAAYAQRINPLLAADLRGRSGRYGTVIQDFCSEEVVRSTVRSNAQWRR